MTDLGITPPARSQAQCGACERYRSPMSAENVIGRPMCAAFPAGIPDVIWNNLVDHRQPVEGDHGLQWSARDGDYPFPSYAFGVGVLDTGPMVLPNAPMVATGASYSGAMIALVPTAVDADRLVLPGGEPVGQLHCTLLYLGDDASAITSDDRMALTTWARAMAAGWDRVTTDAFAIGLFNPDGDDPCATLLLSGTEIAEFCDTTRADVLDLIEVPEQHEPYIPHITLMYFSSIADGHVMTVDGGASADLAQMMMRSGPVNFDRLRLAFGGEVIDVPFNGYVPAEPESTPESTDPIAPAQVAAASVSAREAWEGCPRGLHAAHIGSCPPAL